MPKGERMGELTTLFDAFYNRFVLRDLFGKIIPGAIILFAISIIVIGSPERILCCLISFSFWLWIILISLSWISGIAVQSVGETIKWIRYFPKWKDDKKKEKLDLDTWYDMYNEFLNKVSLPERAQHERYIVIMEVSGNGSVAFLISLFLLVSNGLIKSFLIIAIVLVLIFFLFFMHRKNVKRQYKYLNRCLIREKKQTGLEYY